MFDNLA